MTETREIVVEEVLPYAPALVWKAITTPELMGRWLMRPTGFSPIPGTRFTYTTTPAGAWDGTIHCEVLAAEPNHRLVFRWQGGDAANTGYGSRLDTTVNFTLEPVEAGARLRIVHAGFELPRNEHAFTKMRQGWVAIPSKLAALAAEF